MIILRIAEAIYRPKKDERGFTLIELLIVIAILAILAAIAIPLVTSRVQEAQEAAIRADIRLLQGAVDLYLTDHEDEAGDLLGEVDKWQEELVDKGYLLSIVEHPKKDGKYTLEKDEHDDRKIYKVKAEPGPEGDEEEGNGGSTG